MSTLLTYRSGVFSPEMMRATTRELESGGRTVLDLMEDFGEADIDWLFNDPPVKSKNSPSYVIRLANDERSTDDGIERLREIAPNLSVVIETLAELETPGKPQPPNWFLPRRVTINECVGDVTVHRDSAFSNVPFISRIASLSGEAEFEIYTDTGEIESQVVTTGSVHEFFNKPRILQRPRHAAINTGAEKRWSVGIAALVDRSFAGISA